MNTSEEPKCWDGSPHCRDETGALDKHCGCGLSATPPAPAQPIQEKTDDRSRHHLASSAGGLVDPAGLVSLTQPSPNPSKPEQAEAPNRWREFLLGLEWERVEYNRSGDAEPMCISCGKWKSDGHAKDCELVALLATLPPASAAGERDGFNSVYDQHANTPGLTIREIAWRCYRAALATKPQAVQEATPPAQTVQDYEAHQANGLAWAVSKWNDEVSRRPLINVHRRTLDDTWRQVVRYFGGDPVALLGLAHDDLLIAARTRGDEVGK